MPKRSLLTVGFSTATLADLFKKLEKKWGTVTSLPTPSAATGWLEGNVCDALFF